MDREASEKVNRITLYWDRWKLVWERDYEYHPYGRAWFDRETGDFVWQSGEDFRDLPEGEPPEEVRQNPDRYEEIPLLTHGDHHEIFQAFLATMPDKVRDLCNNASIGGFLKDLEFHFPEEEGWHYKHYWDGYRDDELRKRAERWLTERGFNVTWE